MHIANANQRNTSTTPAPTRTPAPRRAPTATPAAAGAAANTPLPRLLFHHLLPLRRPLFLSPPVAAFFIVFADPQRAPQLLALCDLSLRQLVHLVALQASSAGPAAVARLLGFEFFAQRVALVVYGVFVESD